MSAPATGGRQTLREIRGVRQRADESRRRWFAAETADLYVWDDADGIGRFELCYGKPGGERSLVWTRGGGFSHARIDDGERLASHNRTPIATSDGAFEPALVALEFEAVAPTLEPRLYRFVLGELYRPL